MTALPKEICHSCGQNMDAAAERNMLRSLNAELVEALGFFLLHAEEDWQVTFKHDIKVARAVLAKVGKS